jgi:hypothetical protein
MGTNAVSLPHTKNETSGSIYHALQLREQSARKTGEKRTGIHQADLKGVSLNRLQLNYNYNVSEDRQIRAL